MYKTCLLYLVSLFMTGLTFASYNQDVIPITYELMDAEAFKCAIVGNTVLGVSRQSNSLYMVYFKDDGSCDMWKQNKIHEGSWWIEKDEQGRDFVRALWPEYRSAESESIFSPENPRFGSATSVWYYRDAAMPNSIHVAGKNFRAPGVVVPGCAFPGSYEP